MKEAIKLWNAGNYFIEDGNKTFYTIRNLRPGTRYSFRISARNKHGSSGESREYSFTTKEEGKYKITRKLLLCIKRICNTLRKMCPYSEFFWFVFSRIQTEYGEIRSQGLIQKKCRHRQRRRRPNYMTMKFAQRKKQLGVWVVL